MSAPLVVPDSPFGDWDGTPAGARLLQQELAGRVVLRDDFPDLA